MQKSSKMSERIKLLPASASEYYDRSASALSYVRESGSSSYVVSLVRDTGDSLGAVLLSPTLEQHGVTFGPTVDRRLENATKIESLFALQDEGQIWRFLFAYPQLASVLLEAHSYLLRHFGSGSRAELRVVTDPEVPDWDQLFVSIKTSLSLDDALVRLDGLLDDWFQTQPSTLDELLAFTVDCI
jgi:hypothetical protein